MLFEFNSALLTSLLYPESSLEAKPLVCMYACIIIFLMSDN